MGFLNNTLSDNEEILKEFKLNTLFFIPSYLAMLLGFVLLASSLFFLKDKILLYSSLGGGVILLLIGIYIYFNLKSINMGITNKRIVYKKGILSIYNEEVQLNAIETVEVSQTILGRILGYGNVKITGRGDAVVLFADIDNPVEIKKLIGDFLS